MLALPPFVFLRNVGPVILADRGGEIRAIDALTDVEYRGVRFPEDVVHAINVLPGAAVFPFATVERAAEAEIRIANPVGQKLAPRGKAFGPLPEGVLSGFPQAAPTLLKHREETPTEAVIVLSTAFALATVQTSIDRAERAFRCYGHAFVEKAAPPPYDTVFECFRKAGTGLENVKTKAITGLGDYAKVVRAALEQGLRDRALRRHLATETELPAGLSLAKLSFTLALLGQDCICLDARLLGRIFPEKRKRAQFDSATGKADSGPYKGRVRPASVDTYERVEDAFLAGNAYYDPAAPLGRARAQWMSWESVGGEGATHGVWLRIVGMATRPALASGEPGGKVVPFRRANPVGSDANQERLAEVDAAYDAIVKEHASHRERYAGPGDLLAQRARIRQLDEQGLLDERYFDESAALEEKRQALWDERWNLRSALGLDPRTGEKKPRAPRAKTEIVGEEGYYPDLLGTTEDLRGGCRDNVTVEDDDGTVVHTSCFRGRFHHLRYFVDGAAVAGLTLHATKRGGKATIDRVYTDPSYRRQGYAAALLEHARAEFRHVLHSRTLTEAGQAWKRAVERRPNPAAHWTGIGASLTAGDVDARELAMGRTVELEHTTDPAIAERIALDHLAEDPRYYTRLAAIERPNPVERVKKRPNPVSFDATTKRFQSDSEHVALRAYVDEASNVAWHLAGLVTDGTEDADAAALQARMIPDADGNVLYVATVETVAGDRRRGHGRAEVSDLLDQAARRGVRDAWLFACSDKPQLSVAFWAAMGFSVVRVRDEPRNKGCAVMHRSLLSLARENPTGSTPALLFSYGSNHPGQLGERLGRKIVGEAAILPGYCRVFRGFSQRWQGGVASLERGKCLTYGYVAEVSEADLETLDRYEGVPRSYQRQTVIVKIGDRRVPAVAYIAQSRDVNPPSPAYLEAVAKTVGAFWRGKGGRVKPSDFPIR